MFGSPFFYYASIVDDKACHDRNILMFDQYT